MPEHEYEQYEHHGKVVNVRKDLRGLHRDHCMCYDCKKFSIDGLYADGKTPDEQTLVNARVMNCPRANEVYRLCVLLDMVLPVWECPEFEKRGE